MTPPFPRPKPMRTDQDPDLASLLLARATFGYSAADAENVRTLGYDEWLDEQLRPERIDDSALQERLEAWPWLEATIMYTVETDSFDPRVLRSEFKGLRILRAVASRRQLFERIVEFWSDHFSVYVGSLTRIFDDGPIWRTRALGRYSDLLMAIIESTTMIFYLDNHANVKGAANENMAREILELYTLGAEGPYTEEDVREFARALTGWTYQGDPKLPGFGRYRFDAASHDAGPKKVLGLEFPAGGGDADVRTVLRHLCDMPATVDYVVRRMARWFLGHAAPEETIAAAKKRWVETDGEVREVLRELLCASTMQSVATLGLTKFRRPLEWLTAVYRPLYGAGGASCNSIFPAPTRAHELSQRLGQAPFEWYPPDGYPDDRASWVGLIEPRWSVASEVLRSPSLEESPALDVLAGWVEGAPKASWPATLDQRWTGGRLRQKDLAAIRSYVVQSPVTVDARTLLAETAELILTCPSFHEI